MMVRHKDYTTAQYKWQGEEWILHPLKGMYWGKRKMLLVTDLHLGKTRHFRRSGIYLPSGSDEATLARLAVMIREFSPKEVVVLGDLFHSRYDSIAVGQFGEWLEEFSQIRWTLVLGNHDIIHHRYYSALGFSYSKGFPLTENIELLHEAKEEIKKGSTISGHLHPGVELWGKGRQKLVLPCFYFGERRCILPAIGKFTGLARLQLKAKSGDVFVTTDEEIFPFSTLQ